MTDPASDEPASSEPGGSEPGGPDGPGLTDGPGRAILRLPAALAGEAREVLSGRKEPVRPRDAASVLLLRPAGVDGPGMAGIEVYMLRRARSMAFAPGMSAFPGGSVDLRDADAVNGMFDEKQISKLFLLRPATAALAIVSTTVFAPVPVNPPEVTNVVTAGA